jgi:membrane protein
VNRQQFFGMLLQSFGKWSSHDATLRAGALTFFTIMPLPSLMLIAAAALAQIYGQGQGIQLLIQQITSFAGPTVAGLFSAVIAEAASPLTSFFGSLIAIVFALAGALGAFSVLQKSLNVIWEIKPRKKRKKQISPFLLILGVGILVVAWTAFYTVFFNAVNIALSPLLGGFAPWLLRGLQVVGSLGLGTLLFAIIFKVLPETDVEWGDVSLAAFITSIMFTFLNYLFGLYLSFSYSTLAGTAGTLIFLFFWVFITNLFVLFGGEFSKVYADSLGSNKDKPKAVENPVKRVDVRAEFEWKVS